MNKKINYNRLLLDSYRNSFIIKNPVIMYENKKQQLDLYNEKIISLLKYNLDNKKNNFNHILEKLELLNPVNILKRGYAITYKESHPITDIKKVKVDDELNIKVSNGSITAVVKKIKED